LFSCAGRETEEPSGPHQQIAARESDDHRSDGDGHLEFDG